MSTVGFAQTSRRHHSSRHRRVVSPSETSLAVGLKYLTDAILVLMLFAVPAWFAGRTPQGQLLFAAFSGMLGLVWSLRQFMARSPEWHGTTTYWLWGAGALLACLQLAPLSAEWMEYLSPETSRLLFLWSTDGPKLFSRGWHTLSLNPAETESGLVTFASYGIVFFVVMQRIRTAEDVGWLLKVIGCSGSAMAVFGIVQYLLSNGLFFWVYQHPIISTRITVLGTFTNRNHLAQFLAITIGPAMWWLSQVLRPVDPGATKSFGGFPRINPLAVFLVTCGLGAMFLAGLMTLSRAGTAAIAVSGIVSLTLLGRRGHLPGKMILMVMFTGLVVGIGALATNYQSLAERIDNLVPDQRMVIWAANVRLVSRFPWFGTGVGTHLYSHPLETDQPDNHIEFTHAESGYLQVASECGFVGLGIAVLMIAVCLNWCRLAYRTGAESQISAMAAAILASFTANLLHAAFDFFWFVPGCMVMITVIAASVCRLAQLAHAADGNPQPVRSSFRLFWAMSLVGTGLVAVWMVHIKLPEALAEPHVVEFQNLYRHGGLTIDQPEELDRMMMAEIVAAARANPRDCRNQLRAASGYLRLFELKQESSENPISLDQLRDAVMASEFDSVEAMNEWIQVAVGPNRKYLKAAQHYARRALQACPLEGEAYILLAQLDFLRDPQGEWEASLQEQALAVRPYNARVDFEIGHAASWKNDVETAMHYWRKAFHRSKDYRLTIAMALAKSFSAEELLEQLQPDRDGLLALVTGFAGIDKEDDLKLVRHLYAKACLDDAPKLLGSDAEFAWLEAVRMSDSDLERSVAIQTAEAGLDHLPQSVELHKKLGVLLLKQEDFPGAAKHLQWAVRHSPDDEPLKQLAATALQESLRHQSVANEKRAVDYR